MKLFRFNKPRLVVFIILSVLFIVPITEMIFFESASLISLLGFPGLLLSGLMFVYVIRVSDWLYLSNLFGDNFKRPGWFVESTGPSGTFILFFCLVLGILVAAFFISWPFNLIKGKAKSNSQPQ